MIKHTLIMLACCLVPIGLISIALASGITLGGILPYALVLICPISMLLMMRSMGHDHSAHGQPAADEHVAQSCHDEEKSVATAGTRR